MKKDKEWIKKNLACSHPGFSITRNNMRKRIETCEDERERKLLQDMVDMFDSYEKDALESL